jgi:hypothetical protein
MPHGAYAAGQLGGDPTACGLAARTETLLCWRRLCGIIGHMPGQRYVFLDFEELRLCVVVAAETAVVYQQQHGGTACMQGRVEGYLLPVQGGPAGDCGEALAMLREIFERDLGGAGWRGGALPGQLMARLRGAVDKIAVEESGQTAGDVLSRELKPLVLDESRLGEMDEAWVPVITADGPGLLVWSNSD